MYKEKIINHQTGEITWRNYSDEEIAEVEKAINDAKTRIEEIEKNNQLRQSALAKLAALGLTEDEIAAL